MKTIMLNCMAGMSTSLLVTSMDKEAKSEGFQADIFACPTSDALKHIKKEKIDCILLGPQVGYMRTDLEKQIKEIGKKIPLDVMDMQAYGTMNGKKILAQAKSMMNK